MFLHAINLLPSIGFVVAVADFVPRTARPRTLPSVIGGPGGALGSWAAPIRA